MKVKEGTKELLQSVYTCLFFFVFSKVILSKTSKKYSAKLTDKKGELFPIKV